MYCILESFAALCYESQWRWSKAQNVSQMSESNSALTRWAARLANGQAQTSERKNIFCWCSEDGPLQLIIRLTDMAKTKMAEMRFYLRVGNNVFSLNKKRIIKKKKKQWPTHYKRQHHRTLYKLFVQPLLMIRSTLNWHHTFWPDSGFPLFVCV